MPVTLETLRYRHPEHKAKADRWLLLEAMVAGGDAMTDEMKGRLLANPDGRPDDVIRDRIKVSTYNNKIGPIISRFNSQLFASPPAFNGSKDKFWEEKFFTQGALLDTDDDARASFLTFAAKGMFNALVTGKAIAQIDTRVATGEATSLDAQKKNGELEPYVLLHPRTALWDWDSDGKGFIFAKLHQFRMRRGRWDEAPVPEHDFTIYQREEGQILVSRYLIRKILKPKEKPPTEMEFNLDKLEPKDVQIIPYEVGNGRSLENLPVFNTKGVFEFPIVTLTVPKELAIADQLFEPQKSYFNQTASAEYALLGNNYAMPIITGVEDDDDNPLATQKMGEGYYLTLKSGQGITTFERSGGSISTALNYRSEIKRDIYDQLQQIAMSAADGAAIIARSAQSKREDRRPEQILLETYGQLERDFLTQILRVASIAHNEDQVWKIEGFDDFLGEGVIEEIADIQQLQTVPVPSPTFKRESAKFLAKRVGKSYQFGSDKMRQIEEELDKAKPEDFNPAQPAAPGQSPEQSPQPQAA